MLTILTTIDHQQEVAQVIATVDRLDELVDIAITPNEVPDEGKLLVVNSELKIPLDWYDTEPPYIFPHAAFSSETLMAHIFYKLGNPQRAFQFISEKVALYQHLLIATHLQFGYEISEEMLEFARENSKHNLAILYHYGNVKDGKPLQELKDIYSGAIENSANDEVKLFTAKHYINLLLDNQLISEAQQLITKLHPKAISEAAKNAMNVQLASTLKSQLELPYKEEYLDVVLDLQEKCIAFYEKHDQKILAGIMLIDAAEVANFKNNFIYSKELINKAIQYFKEEDIPELLGEAGIKKAVLLYTWSKNGSPQYYKAAINAFQDTLKVFKRNTHPQKFAEVHHHLALIYSEIPASDEEKPIWTAFSASSFKNVLEFYNKQQYPYQYAMVNHNYATALMDFPPAKIHDNLAKANAMFEEALQIRTASKYPMERALTLLNQLELYWLSHNENQGEEEKKLGQMVAKANEVKELISDQKLIAQADNHLKRLEELALVIKKS